MFKVKVIKENGLYSLYEGNKKLLEGKLNIYDRGLITGESEFVVATEQYGNSLYKYEDGKLLKLLEGKRVIYNFGLIKGESEFLAVEEDDNRIKSLYKYKDGKLEKLLESKRYIYFTGLIEGKSEFLKVEEQDKTESLYIYKNNKLLKILNSKKEIEGGIIEELNYKPRNSNELLNLLNC